MAKCSLRIELADKDAVYRPGSRVKGQVFVRTDAQVNCKGLELRSGWATHGRGNVDSGHTDTQTVFTGQWDAGSEYVYPFDLQVGDWPPTYHGRYLSVDHYVTATAKIPWAFDPTESYPFRVQCDTAPEDGVPHQPEGANSCLGQGVGMVFVIIFFGVFAIFFSFLAIPIAIFGGLWWYIKKYLPKKRLGEVKYEVKGGKASPGDVIEATVTVHPKKDVAINGIVWNVIGQERCTHGSGSNRTTHTHEIYSGGDLITQPVLTGNQDTTFKLKTKLPTGAFYTMSLGDNEIQWTTNLRIDIPRWPDYTTTCAFQMVPPPPEGDKAFANIESTPEQLPDVAAAPASSGGDESMGVTFEATIQMLDSVRDEPDQIDRIIDAVSGINMQLKAIPERRELYGSGDSPHSYPDGHVVIGRCSDAPLGVTMFIPRRLADEFEQSSDQLWTGAGHIVGYDHRQNRLQLKVL